MHIISRKQETKTVIPHVDSADKTQSIYDFIYLEMSYLNKLFRLCTFC